MSLPKTRSPIKECDVRGEYPSEVNESLFDQLAQNFGHMVANSNFENLDPKTVVVGGDGRTSTPSLKEKVLAGLVNQGLQVIHLEDPVPTPVIYWAKQQIKAQAVAIVTASHNQPSWNGLKVMNGPHPPGPKDILALANRHSPAAAIPGASRSWKGVHQDYIDAKIQLFSSNDLSSLKIVVDPGNGCQAGVAAKALAELKTQVVEIHGTLDGRFPERHPDCSIKEHLADLAKAVVSENADLGIAFDGDGDRLAVVDNTGRFIPPEQVAMILLQGHLKPTGGRSVVIDIKSTMHFDNVVKAMGGVPIRCRSGHAYMKEAVIANQAILGSEVSGHHFLGDLKGLDDPLHVALVLCSDLAKESSSLSELINTLPTIYMTPDLRMAMEEDDINSVLEGCQTFPNVEIEKIDGIRLLWPDGWFLARRSVTEQALTFRLEGQSPEVLQRIADQMIKTLPLIAKKVNQGIAHITQST